MAARTCPLVGRSRRYRGIVVVGMVGGVLIVFVWAGERPSVGRVGVVASLIMLPSIVSERCVILKVPASCASEMVGVAKPSGVSAARILSFSSIVISCIFTAAWMSTVPAPSSASPESSDAMLSVLGSS